MADARTSFILGGALVTHHELQNQHIYLAHLLEEIRRQNNAIILLLTTGKQQQITPELEAAINRTFFAAKKIDQKVPDRNVPPGTQPG